MLARRSRAALVLLLAVVAACGPDDGRDTPPDARRSDGGPTDPDPTHDAGPDAPLPARVHKALVIGVDGVRFDKLAEVNVSAMRALAERGFLSRTWLYASPMAPTDSGPGWATIGTGVWPDKHHVLGNDFRDHNLAQYPDFLTRIESVQPELDTVVV